MEIWKRVNGYLDRYEVSSTGLVRSLDMLINNKHGSQSFKKGRVLKSHPNKKGYPQVTLCLNGVNKTFRVHRLVASAFIDNPENKSQVNHINGIKDDNRVENLEWCTNQENIIHAYSNNLINTNKGEKHHNSKLTDNQVELIKEYLKSGSALKPLAEYFNVSITVISNIKNKKTWI